MHPTTYGRCELALYGEMARRSLERLAEALAAAGGDSAEDGGLCADVRALLEEALRRKSARLRSVFPDRELSDLTGRSSDPEDQLSRVAARWIDSVMALADDGELDVPRNDLDGQARHTTEIVADAILADAVLAGKINQIRCRSTGL